MEFPWVTNFYLKSNGFFMSSPWEIFVRVRPPENFTSGKSRKVDHGFFMMATISKRINKSASGAFTSENNISIVRGPAILSF
jgi:hypothetical protein